MNNQIYRNPRITITITRDLLEWLDKNVKKGVFRSRATAIHSALLLYREELYKLRSIERL